MFNIFRKKNYLSREDLENLDDMELEFAINNALFEYIGDNYRHEYKKIKKLSKELQYFYATWSFEAEVNNGGFNQFFFNSSNQFLSECSEGLAYYKANDYLLLLEDAIKVYNSEIDLHNRVKLKGTIEAFSKSYEETDLNDIDDKFYSIDGSITQFRVEMIRKNLDVYLF